jgi:uncharacterized membrane protein
MHRASLAAVVLGLAVAALPLVSASPANAHKWTVCNRGPDNVDVAIAYPTSNGYTSEGWWTLRACGGCAVVFNGTLAASLVFLRGESASGAEYGGTTLFCTARSPFTMARSNTSRRNCERRGGQFKTFGTQKFVKTNHTTNLLRPSGSRSICID